MQPLNIPFNKPYLTGKETEYIAQVFQTRSFAGNGKFSKKCAKWLEETTGCKKAILVPSGTAALEMMMLLANIGPGDEVIMPSFTFSSTANAVVLRGATPVFIDIRPDTLNMDENLIEDAITPKTKAILPVHYAGVACQMDSITAIAEKNGLLVLEDAAQGIMAYYKGHHLGTIGQMGALSFHETKNIQCGEGGALLINDPSFIERAEILMEKGTDRSKFFRGEVDKYTWVDIGSSYLINEITAAFLLAQLEEAEKITKKRVSLWNSYHENLESFEKKGYLKRPTIPPECSHNGHIFYVILEKEETRDRVLEKSGAQGINATFHYIPLENTKAGKRFTRTPSSKPQVSTYIANRLVRLPLYPDLNDQNLILQSLAKILVDTAVQNKLK